MKQAEQCTNHRIRQSGHEVMSIVYRTRSMSGTQRDLYKLEIYLRVLLGEGGGGWGGGTGVP